MSEPIAKDVAYFSFWASAMGIWFLLQVCQIILLASILREVRR